MELFNAWLKNMYEREMNMHLVEATGEHLASLGSMTSAEATMHEENADNHRAFAKILEGMMNET